MTSKPTTQQSPDVLIIGAGACGLWTAYKAVQRDFRVKVIDKVRAGAGASGGVLGALMPNRPSRWTDEKQFQLEALVKLPDDIDALEEMTGKPCGYRRCGRLMPIDTDQRLQEHRHWQQAALEHWQLADARWDIVEPGDMRWQGQVSEALAYDFDTLSARLDPRALMDALVAGIRELGGEVCEGIVVSGVGPDGTVLFADGSELQAGHVVLAAGYQTFGLLDGLGHVDAGWGVKGQSVLLKPATPLPDDLPVLYHQGTYIVRHDNGLAAVGSTSERDFVDLNISQDTTAKLVRDAQALCPALAVAEVIESWVGVRPRCASRKPMVGPLPSIPRIIAVTGGFKITLGIAHKMADAAVEFLSGHEPDLPEGFTP